MNEEKINYWLEVFRDNKYAFMSKDGLVIPIYTAFEQLKQLEHNWNELKKYIGSEWYCFDNDSVEYDVAKDILNKMQELEEGGNNE